MGLDFNTLFPAEMLVAESAVRAMRSLTVLYTSYL